MQVRLLSVWTWYLNRVAVLIFIYQEVLDIPLHLLQYAAIGEDLHRLLSGVLSDGCNCRCLG